MRSANGPTEENAALRNRAHHGPGAGWRSVFDRELWRQGLVMGTLGAVSMAVFACAVALARDTTGHYWYATAKLFVAELMIGAGLDENEPVEFRNEDGVVETVTRSGLTYALRETWEKQAAGLGFDAKALVASAMERGLDGAKDERGRPLAERRADLLEGVAREAVDWALAHLSERDAVFAKTDLLAAALAYAPGAAPIGAIERAVTDLQREGRLHDAPAVEGGGGLTTDKAVADERETIALMRAGEGRGKAPMRGWMVDRHLRKGPLTAGQKQAVKLILSERDRTVGVQGYAGAGKTRMLHRARTLAEKKGWRMIGLAPSASAVQTLAAESGIASETLQRFLARNAGVAGGRLTKKGAKEMRAPVAEVADAVGEEFELECPDLGAVLALLQVAHLGDELVDAAVESPDLGVEGVDEAPEQALALVGELGSVGPYSFCDDAEGLAYRLDGVVLVPDDAGVELAALGGGAVDLGVVADGCGDGLGFSVDAVDVVHDLLLIWKVSSLRRIA